MYKQNINCPLNFGEERTHSIVMKVYIYIDRERERERVAKFVLRSTNL